MEGRIALISDVDNTLLGGDDALRRFAAWASERRDRLHIAYASGRFVDSILESVAATDLPLPDAVIGGVGTQIRLVSEDRELGDWPSTAGWSAARARAIALSFAGVTMQPDELQSPFKVSCFAYEAAETLGPLAATLRAAGVAATLVYSSDRDLDILPASTNKGTAAVRLAEHWRLSRASVLVSGDSGNDLALFEHGFRGIVVANAHAELKRLDGPNVYHAKRPCAGGVLEGLERWLADSAASTNGAAAAHAAQSIARCGPAHS